MSVCHAVYAVSSIGALVGAMVLRLQQSVRQKASYRDWSVGPYVASEGADEERDEARDIAATCQSRESWIVEG
jgi:hypothetical protein